MRLMLDGDARSNAIEAGDDEWKAQVVAAFHRLQKIEVKIGAGPPYRRAN